MNELINKIANMIGTWILYIVAVIVIILVLYYVWYPYAVGDYKMKTDYYEKTK